MISRPKIQGMTSISCEAALTTVVSEVHFQGHRRSGARSGQARNADLPCDDPFMQLHITGVKSTHESYLDQPHIGRLLQAKNLLHSSTVSASGFSQRPGFRTEIHAVTY